MEHKNYQHWKVDWDEQNIAWVYFDRAHKNNNTFNTETLDELEQLIDTIAAAKEGRGVVFASQKKSGFVMGADTEEIAALQTIEEVKALIQKGQKLFNRIEKLTIPSVACMEGFCLGGGLEFALACRYRIVLDSDKKQLGLPEVLLGIHPGWGGTIRLPRLIGAPQALDLILSGRMVAPKTAQKMGFVDKVLPKRYLTKAARHYILKRPKPHQANIWQRLTHQKPLRKLIAAYIEKYQLGKRINPEHYPAPYAVLKNWQQQGIALFPGLQTEADSIARLALSATAKNLLRVFFLRECLKHQAEDTEKNLSLNHIHIVGAGAMGRDIASWCALQGLTVTLQDTNRQALAASYGRAYRLCQKKLSQRRAITAVMDRLIIDEQGDGIKQAQLIIEAIAEKLEPKQKLLQAIEGQKQPDALIATNTSSIPLDELGKALQQPECLIGIHFFNPVAKMQLVEIVYGKKTPSQTQTQALQFVKQIQRLPVLVTSTPGFLVNRILMPYLMEAMLLLEEGVAPDQIDKAAEDFGMPMGPVKLADWVGLDICLSVADHLSHHFATEVPEQLRVKVEQGTLGRKTKQGFYKYDTKGHINNKKAADSKKPADLTDRLILRLVNEAMACLRQGIVADADQLDAAMVFGAGFAPFRGGPMHYAHERGLEDVGACLQQLTQQYGDRFQPDEGWSQGNGK
jgi:3-hydroxyacyl-CoA dehydrogenase/enoyl-CoA hydratase/3-hydroxybutyryl-CoA epimerase